MKPQTTAPPYDTVDAIYRAESRRVFATLVRLPGDFDTAEEALHEASRAALEQWPCDGVPANPRAWLVSAGRFKFTEAVSFVIGCETQADIDHYWSSLTEGGDPAEQKIRLTEGPQQPVVADRARGAAG
jgi:hypothetical protein